MKPLIIGIAGGTGSGKSTVARRIAEALTPASVAFLDMDAYYRNFVQLTLDERRKVNWDHPDAFDIDLMVAHLDLSVSSKLGQRAMCRRSTLSPAICHRASAFFLPMS